MTLDQFTQKRFVAPIQMPTASLSRSFECAVLGVLLRFRQYGLERDHCRVASLVEGAILVEDVGDTAAHASRKIATSHAEHNHGPSGHVLATVISGAFDHGHCSRIAHAEALAGNPAKIRLALDCAVHDRVTHDNVFL